MQKPKLITFTGVDARTDLVEFSNMAFLYPIELGFLFSDNNKSNRFTGTGLIHTAYSMGIKTSLHLCGAASRRALAGEGLPWEADFAHRIQVNSKSYDPEELKVLADTRKDVHPDAILDEDDWEDDWDENEDPRPRLAEFIWQHRNVSAWPPTIKNARPLLDLSGGRGTLLNAWPDEPPAYEVGYAGGLAPGKVKDFLRSLPEHTHPFWIDMETGVRTDDWFDFEKCFDVCQEVFG